MKTTVGMTLIAVLAVTMLLTGTGRMPKEPRMHAESFVHMPATAAHMPKARYQVPEKSCRIDPATGCHYGHHEASHPGGCLCGR